MQLTLQASLALALVCLAQPSQADIQQHQVFQAIPTQLETPPAQVSGLEAKPA